MPCPYANRPSCPVSECLKRPCPRVAMKPCPAACPTKCVFINELDPCCPYSDDSFYFKLKRGASSFIFCMHLKQTYLLSCLVGSKEKRICVLLFVFMDKEIT
ncbi:uncharacterized protein B0P05DRAFT_44200 [Gilbertella persicaria]|uniref:uncharacterized protein n=1 Tax=Gilbertella persicaria TaxID=101096 RepID=UPI0022207B07|nr:uncharacterized protein B0P05DRAFT_44200 [Gilbertella persicaria]KAI8084091.1 hypothetical protein B0P05DRAFT_44200 [Gilbertella persicaria]